MVTSTDRSPAPLGISEQVPVIELQDLCVHLGNRLILNQLRGSLKGNIVGLLGPNGAGKTTLLRTLLGFYSAGSGDARVLGHSLRSEGRDIRALVGYMPEDDAHIAGMTAIRWVRFLGELSGLPSDTALERGHEALGYVGLGEARYRKVGTFSTGMKQLVKLAQALVHGPRLLLLDEPTNGLDPAARARFLELVTEVGARGETRILISSHLLGDVERVCDEVVILKAGILVATCDLRTDPDGKQPFVELELSTFSREFIDNIEAQGCGIVIRAKTRIQVELPTGLEIRDLFRAALSCGIGLRRVNLRRDSLQDVFLRAMEDNNASS